jgi:hypothetical protein
MAATSASEVREQRASLVDLGQHRRRHIDSILSTSSTDLRASVVHLLAVVLIDVDS